MPEWGSAMTTRSSARQQGSGVDFRREAEAAASAAGMSIDDWTRSILGERPPSSKPRGSAEPALPGDPPIPPQPVDRILSSLDRLGERIRAMSAKPIVPDPAPEPSRNTAPDLDRDAGAASPAIELHKAIEQIARKRDALDRAATRAGAEPEPMPALAPPPMDASEIAALRADIAAVREILEASSAAPRLTALENAYDEVVRRLDHLRGAIDNPRTVADLVQRLAEIRRLLAQAPTESQFATVADRIDRVEARLTAAAAGETNVTDLVKQVAGLATAVSSLDPADLLGAIDARLDQVGRQVIALEARLGGLDGVGRIQDTVDRQAAVLSMLAQRTEQMPRVAHEMERQSAAVDSLARRVEALPQLMTDVAELRGTVDAESIRVQQGLEALVERIDDLAARAGDHSSADRLAAFVDERLVEIGQRLEGLAAAPLDTSVVAALEDRISEMAATVERRIAELAATPIVFDLPAELTDALARIEAHLAAETGDDRLSAIETRIAGIAETVEAIDGQATPDFSALEASLAAMRQDIAGLAPPSIESLEDEVRALAGAVAEIRAPEIDPEQLDRLDRRIGEIVDRLDRAPGDAARLEEAIGRIEATIASAFADRGAMESAAIAAARTVLSEDRASGPDRGLEEVRSDLHAAIGELQRDLRGGADRDRSLLIAIGEAVERLATREFEIAERAAAAAPASALAEATPAVVTAQSATWSEIERTLSRTVAKPAPDADVPEAEAAAPDAEAEPEKPAVAAPRPRSDDWMDAISAPAPALGSALDDRPLEPGSGKPSAGRTRAHGDDDGEQARTEPSKADFIAAARRAAQAASASIRVREDDPRNPSRKSKARFAGLAGDDGEDRDIRSPGFVRRHRKSLLAAAAMVVVLVAGARAVAPLLTGDPQDQAVEATLDGTSPSDEIAVLMNDDPGDPAEAPSSPDTATQAPVPPAIVDETATAADPIGPVASFGDDAEMPPPDKFEPRADAAPDLTASLPQTTPAAPAALPSPPEDVGPLTLRHAAIGGDPAARFEVASRLTEGRGVEQDLVEAARWYRLAAEAGLPLAQYRLGSLYEKGQGVPRDVAAAIDWYARAAEAGNAKAMHNVAVLNAEGSGDGEPDYETAAKWFSSAAEHGVRDSQFNLGILYAKGLGVPRDLTASYKWFAIAATGGDPDAAKKRDDIAQVLDKDALARARLAVETWTVTTPSADANEPPVGDPSWLATPEQTAVRADGGDLVADAQAMLAGLGYDPGPADGQIGERTRLAIEAFQRERGLPVTGAVDDDLVRALAERRI
ncbi:MAG TPA: peptidoglycan-binding protein [Methylomirabilota bacterium]|nr:peptidoglycan-binding protein [Methylomirabilota bacterium]